MTTTPTKPTPAQRRQGQRLARAINTWPGMPANVDPLRVRLYTYDTGAAQELPPLFWSQLEAAKAAPPGARAVPFFQWFYTRGLLPLLALEQYGPKRTRNADTARKASATYRAKNREAINTAAIPKDRARRERKATAARAKHIDTYRNALARIDAQRSTRRRSA